MAVYQGARQRAGLELPWLRRGRSSRPADAATPAVRSATRRSPRSATAIRPALRGSNRVGQRRVGVALAGIVVVFSVGFVSLSQSVRVAATSYDITRLVSERDRLSALQQDLGSDVERLRGEPAIRKEALDAGLGQLGPAVVLPAR
ncbi:MAG TPA: hypothetical protein VKC59_00165 [Candidatus Limnocylindrales bacterium]|nr:hypothetical protein [Candidatus Limnocylindrales bacterium]